MLEREAAALEGWGLAPLEDHAGITSIYAYTDHYCRISTAPTQLPSLNLESRQFGGQGSTMADPFDAAVYVIRPSNSTIPTH